MEITAAQHATYVANFEWLDELSATESFRWKGFVVEPGAIYRNVRTYTIRVAGDNEILSTVNSRIKAVRWIDELEQELFG